MIHRMTTKKKSPVYKITAIAIWIVIIIFILPIILKVIGIKWTMGMDILWGFGVIYLIFILAVIFVIWFVLELIKRIRKN